MRSLCLRLVFGVFVALGATFWLRGATSADGLWDGVVTGENPNVRSAPTTAAPIVGTLHGGSPIQIEAWVRGERVEGVNETWGEIAPGEYVYSAELGKPLPAAPPRAPETFAGHWIDANLTEQILTAYDGTRPVYWAVMSSGAPGGTETDPGTYRIWRRVPNETMRSSTLAFAVEIPYDLPNVLYTQYFTSYGAAIHDNWWKGPDSPFGVPTSHACLGLREADARFVWNWASLGTVLNVHP